MCLKFFTGLLYSKIWSIQQSLFQRVLWHWKDAFNTKKCYWKGIPRQKIWSVARNPGKARVNEGSAGTSYLDVLATNFFELKKKRKQIFLYSWIGILLSILQELLEKIKECGKSSTLVLLSEIFPDKLKLYPDIDA